MYIWVSLQPLEGGTVSPVYVYEDLDVDPLQVNRDLLVADPTFLGRGSFGEVRKGIIYHDNRLKAVAIQSVESK
jgi:hypothetical protein